MSKYQNIRKTIFDKKGTPSLKIMKNMYLVSCTHKVYAGYIENDRVHDFNGTQRGWFNKGVLRDLHGKCVGFTQEANGDLHPKLPSVKNTDGISFRLSIPPLKPVSQEQPFNRPNFKREWADKNPSTLMIP